MTPAELEAVGLRVRKLVWERDAVGQMCADAFGVEAFYIVVRSSVYVEGRLSHSLVDAAACEAHHATRIAGELEPLPEGTEK